MGNRSVISNQTWGKGIGKKKKRREIQNHVLSQFCCSICHGRNCKKSLKLTHAHIHVYNFQFKALKIVNAPEMDIMDFV